MPWKPNDAKGKTKKATTPKAQRQWSKVANNVLDRTGSESRAVRAANSVIKKRREKRLENKPL